MAQKLIYISKNLLDSNGNGALDWLSSTSGDVAFTSPLNKYYHSLVFTQDNYLVTHGKIYNGHDTITSTEDLQTLGLYTSTGKINNSSLTVYVDSNTTLPSDIYAPTTAGTKGQFLISNGGTNAPIWTNLKDILMNTTYGITTNDPSTTNCVLKYTTSGLTWSPDNNNTYKLTLNNTTNGTSSGTSLGTFYAPTTGGTLHYVLRATGANTAPTWQALTSNLSGVNNEDNSIPTSYAVKTYITDQVAAAVTLAMVYQGTVESHTALPVNAANGDVYMFTGSGTYGSGNDAKAYKAGDTAIAKVSNNTVTWEIVPSGNELETFITVTTNGSTVVTGYNKATGEVKLGNAALKYFLADASTIAGNTTSVNLVSAKQVADYIAGLNYSTTTGTVTSITAGRGLAGGTITLSGTIDVKLSGGDATVSGSRAYSVALDSSGNLAVEVPWAEYTYFMGASGATSTVARTSGNDVYVTSKSSTSSTAVNLLGLHAGTGITIASDANKLITITNQYPNVTTSMLVGASNSTSNAAVTTNGNLYLRLKEGNSYSNFNIIGAGATSVTSTGNGNITITSSNTWRPILAYNISNVGGEVLGSSITTNTLAFGSEFLYAEDDSTINSGSVSEIHLAWAEVDSEGAVTYAV